MSSNNCFTGVLPVPIRGARLDRFSIGVRGSLPGGTDADVAALRSGLTDSHEIEVIRRSRDPREVTFKALLHSEESGALAGHAKVSLVIHKTEGGLQLGDRSSIEVNPIKLTRGLLGGDAKAETRGLDGGENVLGLHCLNEGDLTEQVVLVGDTVRFVRSVLKRLTPRPWQRLTQWQKAGELCLDVPVDDAIGATRLLQASALHGATRFERDTYRTSAAETGRSPVARWFPDASGMYYKAYPKLPELLRLEVCYPSRKALAGMQARRSYPLHRAGVVQMVTSFAGAASEPLADLSAHARAVLHATRTRGETLVRLLPLLDMAAGRNMGRGPRPTERSVATARSALEALSSAGMFDAAGTPREHAARRVLDAMVKEGTLTSHPSRALYYLAPMSTPGPSLAA